MEYKFDICPPNLHELLMGYGKMAYHTNLLDPSFGVCSSAASLAPLSQESKLLTSGGGVQWLQWQS